MSLDMERVPNIAAVIFFRAQAYVFLEKPWLNHGRTKGLDHVEPVAECFDSRCVDRRGATVGSFGIDVGAASLVPMTATALPAWYAGGSNATSFSPNTGNWSAGVSCFGLRERVKGCNDVCIAYVSIALGRFMFEGLLQPMHLLVILIVGVFVFGPKKLPELGKGLGEGIRGFKSALKDGDDGVSHDNS